MWTGMVEGLCGNYDYNDNNDYITQSGLLESDVYSFANSWKTDPFCPDVTADPSTFIPCSVRDVMNA